MHDTLLIKCYLNLQIHLHSKDGSLSYSQIRLYSSMGNKSRCWVGKCMLQMPIYCSQKHRKHRKQWSIQTNCKEATTSHQLDWSSHLSSEIFLWPTIIVWEKKTSFSANFGWYKVDFYRSLKADLHPSELDSCPPHSRTRASSSSDAILKMWGVVVRECSVLSSTWYGSSAVRPSLPLYQQYDCCRAVASCPNPTNLSANTDGLLAHMPRRPKNCAITQIQRE